MQIRDVIKDAAKRFGREVCFISGEWVSLPFYGFIQPLRYKNKMYLKDIHIPAGIVDTDVFLYIGPYDHDPSHFDKPIISCSDGEKYVVSKSEKVFFGEEVAYIWTIIRKFTEDDYEL